MNQTSTLTGQCVAEFLGAGIAQRLRRRCGSPGPALVSGRSVSGAYAAMAIYLTAGVSGAHLNPAVTIALWLFACFERRKVLPFIVAQTAGAFCAAALVYGLYRQLFLDLEQSQHIVRGTAASLNLAGVFSTPASTYHFYTSVCRGDHHHGNPDGDDHGPDRRRQRNSARAAGAVADWLADRRDRRVDGAANRLCAESGARLRPKTVYQSGRVGLDRFYRWAGDPYFLVPCWRRWWGAIIGAFCMPKLIGRHLPFECGIDE